MHKLRLLTLSCLCVPLVACGTDSGGDGDGTGTATSGITNPGSSTSIGDSLNPTTSGSSTDVSGTVGDSESATEVTATTQAGTVTEAGETTIATGDDTTGDGTTGDGTTGDGTTGDGTTTNGDTTTNGNEDCEAPGEQASCDGAADDIFKAIGLNCSDDPATTIPITNPVIMSPDASAYRVATRFGSAQDPMDPAKPAWGPKEGERFLVIGSGTFPPLQADGALIEQNNQDTQPNGNPDNQMTLPGIMHWEKGSNNGMGGTPFMGCDGLNDCSDTIEEQWNGIGAGIANDVFYMSFDVKVPAGTHGYLLDFVYFTEEWPNYVNATVNDMLIVWSTSETFTGNVTFIENQPLTVTALDTYLTIHPGDPLLAGTGFPGDDEGAATGWYTAKGSASPGETFTVAISVMDLGDTVWDTVGIIDNFRWDCEGCIPSEVDSCGIRPQ